MDEKLNIEDALDQAAAEQSPVEAKKKGRKKAVAVEEDSPLGLSEAEMERLEQEAEEEVASELKANMAEEYKKNHKAMLKRKALFRAGKNDVGDDLVEVLIDLPPYCEDIRLDGVIYAVNQTYKMGHNKAAVIKDQIARAWKHQEEVSGSDENKAIYRRSREAKISARG